MHIDTHWYNFHYIHDHMIRLNSAVQSYIGYTSNTVQGLEVKKWFTITFSHFHVVLMKMSDFPYCTHLQFLAIRIQMEDLP